MEAPTSRIKDANPKSVNFINSKSESLEFEIHPTQLVLAEEVYRGMPLVQLRSIQRVILAILTGACTGIVGACIIISFDKLAEVKYEMLHEIFIDFNSNAEVAFIAWFLWTVIPAMIGSALVVFIEPKAAGGGIAPVLGFVNGVKVPGVLTTKVIAVKSVSVLCNNVATLAGGMEGPMVHIGACIGAAMPLFHVPFTGLYLFREVRNDVDRRNTVGAGIASGIVGAFSTPIGGSMMALEEGMTFWSLDLMFRIFLAAITATFTLNLCLSFISDCKGCLVQKSLLFFSVVQENFNLANYTLLELPLYIILGAGAGLAGALWNFIQIKLIILRKTYINKKWKQFLEMFVIAFMTSVVGWIIFMIFQSTCIGRPSPNDIDHATKATIVPLSCTDENQFSVAGVFNLQNAPNLIRTMFSKKYERIGLFPLFCFYFFYFILSVTLMGSMISAGIFIPNLLLGAIYGRLFGEFVRTYVIGYDWVLPSKYSYLASGAHLCAVTRIPFTLGVIMMEAGGRTILGYPIFTALFSATIVGNLFNESIYHHQCRIAGMPLVDTDPAPLCSHITASNVMNTPVETVTQRVKIERIVNMLTTTNFNCFPVVKTDVKGQQSFVGVVTRAQLVVLLKHQLHTVPIEDGWRLTRNEFPSRQNIQSINKETLNMTEEIDLAPFMNSTPYTIQKHCSFDTIYRMICNLGLRHVVVVDSENKVAGMITRKNVATYVYHSNVIHASVVKLPVK